MIEASRRFKRLRQPLRTEPPSVAARMRAIIARAFVQRIHPNGPVPVYRSGAGIRRPAAGLARDMQAARALSKL